MPSYKEDLLFTQPGYNVGSAAAPPNVFSQNLNATGATSGTTVVVASAVASGTLTLPAGTDTLIGKATTDTLTNKTLTAPTINSPVLVTPALGVATATSLNASGTITSGGLLTSTAGASVTGGSTIVSRLDMPQQSVTLANGANNNVGLNGMSFARISGPSGGFSITGFTGGEDGRMIYLFNAVSQTMTIANASASSSAGNKITTLTGSDVVLRSSLPSFATFMYDISSLTWILVATN